MPGVVESLNPTGYGTMTRVRACLGGWCKESRKRAGLGGTMSERTASVDMITPYVPVSGWDRPVVRHMSCFLIGVPND